MPFLLLLFLTLACLPDDWPAPAAWVGTPARSALLTWLAMGLGVATAAAISREAEARFLPASEYARARTVDYARMAQVQEAFARRFQQEVR